ncbi:helix-turn-helix domain-containing protein (plasmid) [Streptosporangium sp. CA-135522]|uniref:helix-turn-helix domain-containing protein n=1 Tax=Streptosporangium sp. CA-135522 TaxID=3240072 RepID=UPI003D94B110
MTSSVDDRAIGLRIKTRREQQGLTQGELAHPELSDSYLSLLEAGKRRASPATLELLAVKLDCSLLELTQGIAPEQVREVESALAAARLMLEEGKASAARSGYAQVLENSVLVALPAQHRAAEFGFALAAEAEGDLEAAIVTLVRMVPSAPWGQLGERDVDAAVALARCYMQNGDSRQAVQLAESIVDGPEPPLWSERFIALGAMLLTVYVGRGDLLRARQWAGELHRTAAEVGTPQAMMTACWAQAVVAVEAGRDDEAVAMVDRALGLCPEGAEVPVRARAVLTHAEVLLAVRPSRAEQCRTQLLIMQEELRWFDAPVEQAELTYLLAHAELLCGRPEEAAEQLRTVSARIEVLPRPLQLRHHLLAGQVLAALDRPQEAGLAVEKARERLLGEPASRHSAHGWTVVAQVLERMGRQSDSADAYRRALSCARLV